MYLLFRTAAAVAWILFLNVFFVALFVAEGEDFDD